MELKQIQKRIKWFANHSQIIGKGDTEFGIVTTIPWKVVKYELSSFFRVKCFANPSICESFFAK